MEDGGDSRGQAGGRARGRAVATAAAVLFGVTALFAEGGAATFERGVRATLSTLAVLVVGRTLAESDDGLALARRIWRRLSPRIVAEAAALFALTVAAAVVLARAFPPLRWGLLAVVAALGGGERAGTLLAAPIAEGAASANPFVALLAAGFVVALLAAIPYLAVVEERLFRRGVFGARRVAVRSLLFGAAHLLAGIPLAGAIALSGLGVYYAAKYARAYRRLAPELGARAADEEALLVAATYHVAYNSIVPVVVAAALALIFALETARLALD